jgi:hypothetical protein
MASDDSVWSSPADEDFIPDGFLGKRVWAGAQQIRFERDAFLDLACLGIETAVASVWTRRNLYFAYWCRFESLHIFEEEDPADERWELWNRDVVEAFLAPPGAAATHYYEFEVAPNNQWLDVEVEVKDGKPSHNEWSSGFVHATQVARARRVWTAEMRIPVEAMGAREIDPDSAWRVNFCRCDGPASERRLMSWRPLNTVDRSFHQPGRFGVLRFAVSEAQSAVADCGEVSG